MPQLDVWRRPGRAESDESIADRQTGGLAAIALLLALVVAGLALVHQLARTQHVEDCFMAGRTNCDQLVANQH